MGLQEGEEDGEADARPVEAEVSLAAGWMGGSGTEGSRQDLSLMNEALCRCQLLGNSPS